MIQNKLKEIMQKKKITQEALAKKVGVSKRSVVYWYANQFQPRMKYWDKIASVLKCSVKDLF